MAWPASVTTLVLRQAPGSLQQLLTTVISIALARVQHCSTLSPQKAGYEMHCAPRYLAHFSCYKFPATGHRPLPRPSASPLPLGGRSVISELVAVAFLRLPCHHNPAHPTHHQTTPPCRKPVGAPATTPRSRDPPRSEGPSCPRVCVRARLPQGFPREHKPCSVQALPPQMQPSTSMGRESQIRIEPWANPAKVTYVVCPSFPPVACSSQACPSSYLAATRSRDPALGFWETGKRRRTGLEVGTRVTDSTQTPIGSLAPAFGGDGGANPDIRVEELKG